MQTGTVNMTSGNVRRVMIAFALPVFLSQTFQQLYNTADSLIVGNLLGKQALAAVSSSSVKSPRCMAAIWAKISSRARSRLTGSKPQWIRTVPL